EDIWRTIRARRRCGWYQILSAMRISRATFPPTHNRNKALICIRSVYNNSMQLPRKSTAAFSIKTKVLRLRLKDKHAKFLGNLAREVNFVWNYCNDLQITT